MKEKVHLHEEFIPGKRINYRNCFFQAAVNAQERRDCCVYDEKAPDILPFPILLPDLLGYPSQSGKAVSWQQFRKHLERKKEDRVTQDEVIQLAIKIITPLQVNHAILIHNGLEDEAGACVG